VKKGRIHRKENVNFVLRDALDFMPKKEVSKKLREGGILPFFPNPVTCTTGLMRVRRSREENEREEACAGRA
jgi:hypothetical protein